MPPSFPIEEVARLPLPGLAFPAEIKFSPDSRLLTYLHSPERSLHRRLYAFDLASAQHSLLIAPGPEGDTEENLSPEEKLRRERLRQTALGVTQYAWSTGGAPRLLFPRQGSLYVLDQPGASPRRLVDGSASPVLDPHFSPDGQSVAYVHDREVYTVPTLGGEPRQVTRGARETGKTHGLAEYVAQEEMDRRQGFWWSPDSRLIAFAEVDESHIPVYRILHQGKDLTGPTAQEDHRYPFAGQPNAKVRLGVVPAEGGEPVWMDLGAEDIYLARVAWLPDGGLCAQLLDREQTALELVRFDPLTGQRYPLLHETSPVWINLHNIFHPLHGLHDRLPGGFIWASERSGFRHLYLYDRQGALLRQLTQGDWMVDSLVGVDEQNEVIYFTATHDGPTQRHLYSVSFQGGQPRRITQAPGTHGVVLDPTCRLFVDTHDSLAAPPTVTLRTLPEGHRLHTLFDDPDPRISELGLQPPELVSLSTQDGVTLYGLVFRPPASFGPGPYPTVVQVYGGPHAQYAADTWLRTVALRAQYLRSLGFLVFILDNRGSGGRGLAFEAPLKHRMGHIEVQDQVEGVQWLVSQGLADPARVGIYGWSYGGYMALMCLLRAPDTFRVAVAGAPVTHWDGYDTCYTERYMGLPQDDPAAYTESSVMHHVADLRGRLLLVHGMIDENVHFRHTARLVNALIRARKPYDLLIFPDERHLPRSLADRVYMEQRIRDYFQAHL